MAQGPFRLDYLRIKVLRGKIRMTVNSWQECYFILFHWTGKESRGSHVGHIDRRRPNSIDPTFLVLIQS